MMNQSKKLDFKYWTLLALFLATTVGISGCQPAGQEAMELLDIQAAEIKIDDLSRTMDFVLSEKRFQQNEFVEKVSTGLNRWRSASQSNFADDTWSLDELAKPVVEQYQQLQVVSNIDGSDYMNGDAFYLHQQSWLDKLSKRLIASDQLMQMELYRLAADYRPSEETEQPLVEIVKSLHKGLADPEAEQLANGLKMFDWVIRNIQMLPETEYAEDEVDGWRLNDSESENLAFAGVKSTGAIRYPWQVMLYSRGDFVERAKLFMAMTQQAGLDSVMLSVSKDGTSMPWCVGLIVGDQIYLFDCKLGMPIPGSEIGSIATLADVRSSKDLLDALDLSLEESLADETKYWVKSDDIQSLDALIYCSPEGVSRRINRLESSLTGDYRMRLTQSPSRVAQRLKDFNGLDVKAWDISFKTHAFRQAFRDAKTLTYDDDLQAKLKWHYLDEAYIDEFPLYRTSRSMYFGGNFESERNSERKNAIENFYSLIYSNKTIDSLGTDKFLQRRLGITKAEGQSVAEFQQRLKIVKGQMRLVRRDAGYFLALCHFDNNNPGAAATWLAKINDASGADSAERWQNGISYLLARAYETRKEYDEAVSLYRQIKDSTQVHGNLIRARILETLTKRLVEP